MADFNLINKLPQTLSNLIVTGAVGGVNLDWDSERQDAFWQTEIWVNTSNDRSTSSLLTTTIGTSFYHQTGDQTRRYYWVRTQDRFGNNNGAWEPTGSTSGENNKGSGVSLTEFEAEDVMNNGGNFSFHVTTGLGGYTSWSGARSTMSTTGNSSGASAGAGSNSMGTNLSSWDTWTDVFVSSYISSGGVWYGFDGNFNGQVEWTTPTGTTGQVELIGRIVLYNKTDSTITQKYDELYLCKLEYDYSKVYWAQRNVSYMFSKLFGGTALDANDQYDIRFQLKKTRTDTGSTWDAKPTGFAFDATMIL